jgi:hypothetical protein
MKFARNGTKETRDHHCGRLVPAILATAAAAMLAVSVVACGGGQSLGLSTPGPTGAGSSTASVGGDSVPPVSAGAGGSSPGRNRFTPPPAASSGTPPPGCAQASTASSPPASPEVTSPEATTPASPGGSDPVRIELVSAVTRSGT